MIGPPPKFHELRDNLLLAGAEEDVEELVVGPAAADLQWALATSPVVSAFLEGLHPGEVGQAVCVVPVRQPGCGPVGGAHGVAAVEDHRIDGGCPADPLAGLLVDRAA